MLKKTHNWKRIDRVGVNRLTKACFLLRVILYILVYRESLNLCNEVKLLYSTKFKDRFVEKNISSKKK